MITIKYICLLHIKIKIFPIFQICVNFGTLSTLFDCPQLPLLVVLVEYLILTVLKEFGCFVTFMVPNIFSFKSIFQGSGRGVFRFLLKDHPFQISDQVQPYRPITLLFFFLKVLKQLMTSRLYPFLKGTSYIAKC